ncbi:hypothetical protein [Pseudomonas aeruginosa]|uniref:hypothetical protein n=1 Tax=Pseudomonas aeruginosa TaxID=287 RepID=UPI00190FB6E3|nr:hypothetical protein [Pseudomonas aeruginosa]
MIARSSCDGYAVMFSGGELYSSHKSLVEQFDAKPTEVSALFSNTLDPARATELQEKMQSAGLPV